MGANRVARPRWPKDVDPVVKIKCRNPFFVDNKGEEDKQNLTIQVDDQVDDIDLMCYEKLD